MKNKVINLDPNGNLTAVKEDDGKYNLYYTTDDYRFDKLEISLELFNMIVSEFGEKE